MEERGQWRMRDQMKMNVDEDEDEDDLRLRWRGKEKEGTAFLVSQQETGEEEEGAMQLAKMPAASQVNYGNC